MTIRQRLRDAKAAVFGRGPSLPPSMRMAGAGSSRLMKGWDAYLQSVNDSLVGNLGVLRARARRLVEDNGEASGLLLDFESEIVGPQGARLQYRATKKRGTPLDAFNDRIEAQFLAWGLSGICTMDGFEDWPSVQRLMVRTVIVDGEFFALKHRGRGVNAFGFSIQPFDADLVDDQYNVPPDASGQSVVMGVKVDRYFKPISYFVWERHPSGINKGTRREVPSSDVVHVYKRVRPGQTRGITWFAAALVTWKLGDQYTESELVQSMLAAAQGGFFVNKSGDAMGSFPAQYITNADGTKTEKPIEMEASPGISRALPGGWEWQAWQPTHPTANYSAFMKTIKRVIGRAFGRSYATLTGDLSDVNFSSMRTDRVREMDGNRLHQEDILVRQFCRPIFAEWLVMADLSNRLGVLPYTPDELLVHADFMCRGWPWIDPLKDAATAKLEIQMRVNSPQRICAARGLDFFDIVDEIAEAQQYITDKGLTADEVDLALSLQVTDQPANGDNSPRSLRLTA